MHRTWTTFGQRSRTGISRRRATTAKVKAVKFCHGRTGAMEGHYLGGDGSLEDRRVELVPGAVQPTVVEGIVAPVVLVDVRCRSFAPEVLHRCEEDDAELEPSDRKFQKGDQHADGGLPSAEVADCVRDDVRVPVVHSVILKVINL